MRRIYALLVCLIAFVGLANAQVVAHHRHELTPFTLPFGNNFSSSMFSIYNNANAYTAIPDAQLIPSELNVDNNTFTSTGNFTVIQQTDLSTTFSVATNQGTITTGSAVGASYEIGSTGTTVVANGPVTMDVVEIDQNPTGATLLQLKFGQATATNEINAVIDFNANTAAIHTLISSTDTTFGSVSFTPPSAPWRLGFAIVNNCAEVFYSTSTSGGTWTLITNADFHTGFDATILANISSTKTALKLVTSQVSTIKVSNLKTGGYGGVGTQAISVVIKPDGSPYAVGNTVYFTTTANTSNSTSVTANGVFTVMSVNLLTNELHFISQIFDTRGGHVYTDATKCQIIYDQRTGDQWFVVSQWGSQSTATNIAKINVSSINFLAPGFHLTTVALTNLSPGGNSPYDPWMACTQWFPSTSTCNNWMFVFTTAANTKLYNTASDPTLNTGWASPATLTNVASVEGSSLIRVPDGSGGGLNWYASSAGVVLNGNRTAPLWSVSNGSLLGYISSTWSVGRGNDNPPHVDLFAWGNNWYIITHDNTLFSTFNASMGNLILATAPRYPYEKYSGPIAYDEETNISIASATSVSVTANTIAGAPVIAYCYDNLNSRIPTSITSTASDTFTLSPVGGNTGGGISDGLFYTTAALGSGAVTYTCNVSAASSNLSISVVTYRMKRWMTLGTLDNAFIGNTSGTTHTSATYNTSGQDWIIHCGGVTGSNNYIVNGGTSIGGAVTVAHTPYCQDAVAGQLSNATNTFYSPNSGTGVNSTLAFQFNRPSTPQPPVFISAARASSSTVTTNVIAGQIAVLYCSRRLTVGTGSFVASSTPSYTWTQSGTQNNQASPNSQDALFYATMTTSGSTVFTCSNAGGTGGQLINVLLYAPGSSSVTLNATTTPTSSSTTYTSSSFSTSDHGIIIACAATASTGAGTPSAGTIGGSAATMRSSTTTGSPMNGCEDYVSPSAQTGITATMSQSGSAGAWVGQTMGMTY